MARDVFLPRTLDEFWNILDARPDAMPYHGGTDVLVHIKEGRIDPSALICLERIAELNGFEDRGRSVFIGAGSTHSEIMENDMVSENLPLLTKALSTLGSPPVRHAGTIGGNLGTASPAGDSLPPLYCLDARIHIVSRSGPRTVEIDRFIRGPGETDLKPGELILGVEAPKPSGFNVHHYEKVGRRRAMACSIASLAALLRVAGDGTVEAARLAWGSVGPTVTTSPEAESLLVGRRLDLDTLYKVAEAAREAVSPISDGRASADYRRQTAGNLVLRLAKYSEPTAPPG